MRVRNARILTLRGERRPCRACPRASCCCRGDRHCAGTRGESSSDGRRSMRGERERASAAIEPAGMSCWHMKPSSMLAITLLACVSTSSRCAAIVIVSCASSELPAERSVASSALSDGAAFPHWGACASLACTWPRMIECTWSTRFRFEFSFVSAHVRLHVSASKL